MITLSCKQVRLIDKLAVEEYRMPSIILMENAARSCVQILTETFCRLQNKKVIIFCGPGNNGGDGFAIARHLHNLNWNVCIILCCCEEKIKGDALINFAILKSMPIKIISQISDEELPSFDLIVDAILGTGFTGEVRPPLCDTITRINRSGKPVLAVDVPSGLDCSTGKPSETTIRAKVTVSFVAVKDVYLRQELKEYLGNVYVGDIGVPRELISRVELLG